MQVPNVLSSLRNNEMPSYQDPIQWTDIASEWADDQELYARLKTLYQASPTEETAKAWVAFMNMSRPIDWPYFLDFFTDCPAQYRTLQQNEVTALKRSKDPYISTMQLLHQYHAGNPKFDAFLRIKGSMQHIELDQLSLIAQSVWQRSDSIVVSKHFPARLAELLNAYPHSINVKDLPKNGAALLVSAMLIGVKNSSFGMNIGDDEHYYDASCRNATEKDVIKFIECLQRNSEWQKKMVEEFEMHWFEPFLKAGNPHHLSFTIYQSLDPSMNLKQLTHFLKKKNQVPDESYSLESISIS